MPSIPCCLNSTFSRSKWSVFSLLTIRTKNKWNDSTAKIGYTINLLYQLAIILFFKTTHLLHNSTAWSTNLVSTSHSAMTKEHNWQIINMSVMPFCHWWTACTYQVCAPSSQLYFSLFGTSWTCHSILYVSLSLFSPKHFCTTVMLYLHLNVCYADNTSYSTCMAIFCSFSVAIASLSNYRYLWRNFGTLHQVGVTIQYLNWQNSWGNPLHSSSFCSTSSISEATAQLFEIKSSQAQKNFAVWEH